MSSIMANLPSATSVGANDLMAVDQGGVTKNAELQTLAQILNISSYEHTSDIAVVSGGMTMTGAGGANHTNVALYRPVTDARGIEVTLDSNPTKARLAFGYDRKNFTFFNFGASGDSYRVAAGRLGTSLGLLPASPIPVLAQGDKIKAVIQGQRVQIFHNSVLCGTMPFTATTVLNVPKKRKLKAGIAWRDYATSNFNAKSIKVYENKIPKYMHFSVDDVIAPLKDLTTNAATYTSIFDNATLAWFKLMHDTYGAVVTLNLFYSDGAWDLGSMATKYKAEFTDNSHWLRFAFHAYNAAADYSTLDTPTALTQFNTMMDAIRAFAGEDCIDTMPRTHSFTGTLATCRAWRDSECGLKGFLTSDDNRAVVYYLNTIQRDAMQQCCEYSDEAEGLMFVKTMPRLDNNDIAASLDIFDSNPAFSAKMHSLAIFCHEGFDATVKTRVEGCLTWAKNHGYDFDFPMDRIPDC